MPVYEYLCPENGRSIEVEHSMRVSLETWGELCEWASVPLGATPAESAVERLIFLPSIHAPPGDSKLKELGFTKLVRREKGVYENVTAGDGEQRYMNADDASTLPDLSKKVGS